jgi:chemotaxis methyl-accepting protein methylase
MTQGPLDDASFHELTAKISRERGFGCASYKEKCLRRRIAVRMRSRGVHTYADYATLLDGDPAEYDRLLDALTINVTKLFRNAEAYAALASQVIPQLWRDTPGRIRVWSAGCSAGQEPYSLAVLFHQYAAASGETHRFGRVDILGTDIDRTILAAASRAEFAEADFAETPAELRARYFQGGPAYTISPEVKTAVRFAVHDLLRDAPPGEAFDLICCRNVLIYFDRESQERIFGMFHGALVPGGYLMLGKVETLLGAWRRALAPVDARERIFRRPA